MWTILATTHTKFGQTQCNITVKSVMLVVKNLPANAGDVRDAGLIPGAGRSPGVVYGNPLQFSCLENLMGWWAAVHRVTKSQTQVKRLSIYAVE